ncbi:hypothetical protein [Rhodovulum strictum]|uniref:Uncharacterized protein n=1 Tax=Rhodovulum strictum TaxID=58314 RepID=A0A844B3E4_9RHOB|nr:hypothetical protein [Rhodovulum strictum]MRH20260.1 hypothetical protein [Rhodovulum strictum]
MKTDRLIAMATRILMRKLMHKGIDAAARVSTGADPDPRAQAQARETAKRARQATRLARRIGRF